MACESGVREVVRLSRIHGTVTEAVGIGRFGNGVVVVEYGLEKRIPGLSLVTSFRDKRGNSSGHGVLHMTKWG